MKLSEIIQDVPGARVIGDASVDVRAVRDDSRAVEPGDVFVAVRGETVAGHDFAARAAAAGAAAVVVARELPVACAQVVVPDTAVALGELAARALGRPADRLTLIAVTGTNGKTTTTYVIESILRAAGHSPGVIGTVSYRYAGQEHPAAYTTPTPLQLHAVLADMVAAGCTHCVMETSSAALAMSRLEGARFAAAAFTNLTQDHLEVHGTMDAYRAAKQRLFSRYLADDGVAIAVVDDPAGPGMLAAAAARRTLRVSADDATAEIHVARASSTIDGIEAAIATPRGTVQLRSRALLGAYNVDNIAVAVAVGEALGLPHAAIAAGVEALPGVPGRVERVRNDAGLDILVDYAHTPDALANVLDALRPLTRRRLICVFGCGGDRDRTKRPLMGRAVAERADLAVVTSDNPRTEEPASILRMILPAVPDPFFVHTDRRTAIRAAVAEATPGDVVVIAGKGHEDYQILGTTKVHFDDREEAAAAVALREPLPSTLIAAAVGADAPEPAVFARAIIDSRIAAPGDLYVAIPGERFDGHAFCAAAVEAGARGLVVERGRADLPAGVPRFEVDDTRVALGHIARAVRRRWGKTVIAITGSTGKTSTKQLIAAALAPARCALATRGSLNNETGVPLTLLGLRAFHDLAVVEMGMRGLGQIAYLCDIAEPDVGVVLNAGVAHVGVVGSEDDIVRGKSEMFAGVGAAGTVVYPADDDRLARHAAGRRAITFGAAPGADVRVVGYASRGVDGIAVELDVQGARRTATLPLVGRHNAINASCAIAAALAAGVSADDAIAGLAHARPAALRSELRRVADRNLLVDCYNANPTSMAAALDALADLRGDATAVAVLGDMLELGDTAPAAHRAAGARAAELGFRVVALGALAGELVAGAGAAGQVAADPTEAARAALAATAPGDWILVKASRGMRLERVVEALATVAAGEG